MTKRVLTQMQCGDIRRLRAEVDDWGQPKWTGLQIAAKVGCSESTVWRVIGKQAAYADMRKVPGGGLSMESAHAAISLNPGTVDESLVAASLARFQQLRTMPEAGERERELMRSPPPSPLDGADAPSEVDGSALATLESRAAAFGLDIEKLRGGV